VTELPSLFRQDAEESIPEEDLLLLEEILVHSSGISAGVLKQLMALTILSDQDIQLLKYYARKPNPKLILKAPDLSPRLRDLLRLIERESRPGPSSIVFKHWLAASRGLRYRWRGRANLETGTIGFFLERDPGERKIGDFYSLYLLHSGDHGEWILGDHQLVAGFGLLAGHAYRVNKGFSSLSLFTRPGQGLLPYRSTHEAWSNRGLGWTDSNRLGRFTVSFSHNRREGYLDKKSGVNVLTSGSHVGSGLELDRSLAENLAIFNWEYESENGLGGFILAEQQWNDLLGQRLVFHYRGVYGLVRRKGQTVFSEWALGRNRIEAYYAGLSLRKYGFQYVLNLRKYEPGYTGFRSDPFSEWGGTEWNESGLYQGLRFKTGVLRMTLFTDRYLRPGDPFHQSGLETGIRAEGRFMGMDFDIQRKQERKQNEPKLIFGTSAPERERIRQSWRITCRSKNQGWKIQYARVSTNGVKTPGEGLYFQMNRRQGKLFFQANWVMVSVQNYGNRLYFWDVNLPGEMVSRMYATSGMGPAFLIMYQGMRGAQIGGRCRFWFSHYRLSEGSLLQAGLYVNIEL
jgi:hypothetical protein